MDCLLLDCLHLKVELWITEVEYGQTQSIFLNFVRFLAAFFLQKVCLSSRIYLVLIFEHY